MDNYALKFESSAHPNLDEINQCLNINYHQIDRKECLKFCIFLFMTLNLPSLSTAFPTCNTDLPLTPVCVLYVEPIAGKKVFLEEKPRKHHERDTANDNMTRADPPTSTTAATSQYFRSCGASKSMEKSQFSSIFCNNP